MRLASLLFTALMALLFVFPAQQVMADNPPPPPGTNPRAVEIKLFLQGLYNSSTGEMNKAQDYDGGPTPRYPAGDFAEMIKIELHAAGSYGTPVVDGYVMVNQGGIALFDLSADYDGDYYITIKNRNHIETVSANTVSFAGTGKVEYDFTDAAGKAYGNNQVLLPGGRGHYGIYAGDVNQDGVLSVLDLSAATDDVRGGVTGYVATDVNGDGVLSVLDLSLATDNVRLGVARQIPPND